MKRQFIFIGMMLIWALGFVPNAIADSEEVEIVTADIHPYSIEIGLRPGFFVEMIMLIEDRIGSGRTPQFYPWARAQALAKSLENKIIFPLTRTPEREDHYDWLIDVTPMDYVFVTTNGQKLSMEEARKLDRVTVQQSTPFYSFLRRQGFTNMAVSSKPSDVHLKILKTGRVNAWFTAKDMAVHAAMENFDDNLTISDPVHTSRIYIAASKSLPQELREQYRDVFQSLKDDGTVDYIIKQYRPQ